MNWETKTHWTPDTVYPKFILENTFEYEIELSTWIPFERENQKYLVIFKQRVAGIAEKGEEYNGEKLFKEAVELYQQVFILDDKTLVQGLRRGTIIMYEQ